MDSREWQEYSQLVDLYKFYLGLIVKANIFAFGITGAIITLLFRETSSELAKYGLVVPFILCVVMGIIFWMSSEPARELEESISRLEGKTRLNVERPLHAYLLRHATWIFTAVYFLMAIGLVGLFILVTTNET